MSTGTSITILGSGTSQGIPVIGCTCKVCTSGNTRDQRTRTAAFVQVGEIGLSIDIGPDFRFQMLRSGLQNVHAVLLTHEHNDHISGLDDLRPVNFLYNRIIPIYASDRTMLEMKRRFYYAFDDTYQYPGKPRVNPIRMDDTPFRVEGVEIIPISVDHGIMMIYGFRIGNLAYITDAKTISDASKSKLRGLEVLILNALRFKSHPSHLSVDEAIDVFHELQPGRCYLTHISHDMGLHEEVEKRLPEGMYLAYDGLKVRVE